MPILKVKNKRRAERKHCCVPVDAKADGPFGQVKTINFSKGGIGFISYQKIPLHKQIPIEIDLPGDQASVLVMGKVQWVRAVITASQKFYQVGVVFEDILQGSRSRLNQYFRGASRAKAAHPKTFSSVGRNPELL